MTATMVTFGWTDLSAEAKEHALDESRELRGEIQCEDVREMFSNDLDELGLGDLVTYWSLGYCQGDGVSFTGSVDAVDITDPNFAPILAMLGSNKEYAIIGGLSVGWPRPISELRISITQNDHHYCHKHTMCLEVVATFDEQGTDADWEGDQVYMADTPIYDAIVEYFHNLADTFEANGYATFDDDLGWGDWFFEDYTFDEDGNVLEKA